MSGARSYHGGQAAEESVAQLYARSGRPIAARRWRGRSGEIDIIAREGERVVFIEVKSSATHARAAERLSLRQQARIYGAAAEFLGREPKGSLTEARFDVALVDATGRIEILENAFAA
ncbi:MAG: YraN family protein [Paracoccaceae bacterium]